MSSTRVTRLPGADDRPRSLPAVQAPGVYEALLTELLAARLPSDESLYRLGALPTIDAPEILARHVANVLAMILRADSLAGDVGRQIELCNELLEIVADHG